MDPMQKQFQSLDIETRNLIITSSKLANKTSFKALTNSLFPNTDPSIIIKLCEQREFIQSLNKPDIENVDDMLLNSKCPKLVPSVLKPLWRRNAATDRAITQNKIILQLSKEIEISNKTSGAILSEVTIRMNMIDRYNDLVDQLQKKKISGPCDMNVNDIIDKVKKNNHTNGKSLLSLRCADIQQAIHIAIKCLRKLCDLKLEIIFRAVRVLKILSTTLKPTQRMILFGYKVKSPSLAKDYLKIIGTVNDTINECVGIVHHLRDVQMKNINKLVKTNQTFGALASYGRYLRLKDRLRKQNVREPVRKRVALFKKLPLDVLVKLNGEYECNYIIFGDLALDMRYEIAEKKESTEWERKLKEIEKET